MSETQDLAFSAARSAPRKAALIEAREAWLQPLAKYKTPTDYVLSSFRGLALPVDAL